MSSLFALTLPRPLSLPRRPSLAFLLALACLIPNLSPANPQPSSPTSPPPNFVFLLTDDQRADTVRALGNPRIQTPNLDRLVRAGTSFTEAHIMGGLQGAVCVPSRAMLLSGRTLFRVREDLRDQATWPHQLRQHGWRTHITGKWHNGANALPRSFDSGQAVFLGGMTDQFSVKVRDLPLGQPLSPERTETRPSSEIFADAAVDFLRHHPPTSPFVLYVSFTSPHDPRTPPPEFSRLYSPSHMALPANFLREHPFQNGEMNIRDEQLLPRPRDPDAVRSEIAAYYAMITHVDAQIGRILDALDASPARHHTYIVWAGDNGLALGSHGLLGKQNLYEHSTRVPLVLTGPEIRKNQRSNALVYLSDLAPTLCELAGVPPPDGSEGRSLVPQLHHRSTPAHPILFTAYRHLQRAIRDPRWKLIEYPKTGRTQLFDLRRDPTERHDLAQNPRFTHHHDRLRAALREAQRQLQDPLLPPTP